MNTYLKNAFNFYGLNNFKFEIIEILDNDKKLLDEKEKYYIKLYNSNNSLYGYNLTDGGEGCHGFKFTEEQKAEISRRNSGKNSAWYGKHHTEETRKKMSEAAKKIDRSYYRGVGNPFYNKKHTTETREKMKKSHEKRDINTYYRHNADGNPPCEKKVLCVETNIIYRSIAAAARELNLKDTHISRVLKGYRKTTGGYHWEYVN
ncbi:MAG: hypothetical protein MJ066_05820 [Clostridia bacterium]|nr:hypothetical protein [Clostridia bacterium]